MNERHWLGRGRYAVAVAVLWAGCGDTSEGMVPIAFDFAPAPNHDLSSSQPDLSTAGSSDAARPVDMATPVDIAVPVDAAAAKDGGASPLTWQLVGAVNGWPSDATDLVLRGNQIISVMDSRQWNLMTAAQGDPMLVLAMDVNYRRN